MICQLQILSLSKYILIFKWADRAKKQVRSPEEYEYNECSPYRRFSKALHVDILGVVCSHFRYSITQDR